MSGCQHPWDSCPCTALLLPDTKSFPGELQGQILPCLHLSQLLPPPKGTSARPGQARHLGCQVQCWQLPAPPHCPLCPPRDGVDTAEQEFPAHPASPAASPATQITPTALPHWAGSPRTALGAVLEDPLPAPPSSPPSQSSRRGCRFYLEPRTNTAEISEVTWHHQSAHGVRPHIPGPASLPLSPSYAHGAHPALI